MGEHVMMHICRFNEQPALLLISLSTVYVQCEQQVYHI